MENTLGVDRVNYVLAMDHLKLGNEELIINIEESVITFPVLQL